MKKKFLFSKENKKLITILNPIDSKTHTQFVGGCVRKALGGKFTTDIDLATIYKPQEVRKILLKNNYKILDLAIKYGSITTYDKNYRYEITTLRKDIKTDGRHAKIKFTNSWLQDSLRRDFTVNAIYCDKFGKIFDPVNGVKDLKYKKINFIGDPNLRIKEDYLRILRFIRFSLEYDVIIKDKKVLSIINQNIKYLRLVSPERLFVELKKILELKNLSNINNKDYFINIINKVYQLRFFERLRKITLFKPKLNYLQILSILLIGYDKLHIYFSQQFRLSNKEKSYLNFISSQFKLLKNISYNCKIIKQQIYFYNKELTLNFLNFIFFSTKKISSKNYKKYKLFIKKFKVPIFPISGNFLIRRGFKQGKSLGKKLKSLKNSWVANDFKLNLREV